MWSQVYDPVGQAAVSTALALLVGLLVLLKAYVAPFRSMVVR